MVAERELWLKLNTEEPIEPAFPICDTHHHLLDRPGNRYMPEDLLKDIGGNHNITKTVFMQSQLAYRKYGPSDMQPVGETEFVQTITTRGASGQYGVTAIAAGIVGFTDLTLGRAVEPVLEAHVAAGKGNFRGIRNTAAWDASPDIPSGYATPHRGLLLNQKFREGFACLKKCGLSFDAFLYFHQLMELVDLARAFPDTPIILNHIGGPIHVGPYAGKREEVLQEWKRGIATLATCPNVVVKLGGLGMPRCGFGWHERPTPPNSAEVAEAISPYCLWVIEQFGASRCMFESNFPMDKVSYSYNVLWNSFKRITRAFSPDERAALFHDTAVRVYRLP